METIKDNVSLVKENMFFVEMESEKCKFNEL